MTTPIAEKLYLAQHLYSVEGKNYATYNPHDKAYTELPIIFGFNNGGSPGWYSAQLVAEDGTGLGGHICSHPGYMPHDLGILDGSRPDRHEVFKNHYPDGYRMMFVEVNTIDDIKAHAPLWAAIQKAKALKGD